MRQVRNRKTIRDLEDGFRPDYWADPDYNIPDESDLNPYTRKVKEELHKNGQKEEKGIEGHRGKYSSHPWLLE